MGALRYRHVPQWPDGGEGYQRPRKKTEYLAASSLLDAHFKPALRLMVQSCAVPLISAYCRRAMEFETVNIVCMGLYGTRVALVPDFSSMEFN
jgi:hypothetical protein